MFKRYITASAIVFISLLSACSDDDVPTDSGIDLSFNSTLLDQEISDLLTSSGIPGASVSLVSVKAETPVYWSKGYGLANVEMQKPVDTTTSFWLGSVSKSVLGVLLQMAKEQGVVDLDADIRGDIASGSGFTIDDPLSREISLRSLANHASGILDSDAYECGYYVSNDDGTKESLISALGLEPSDLGLDVTCDENGSFDLSNYLAAYLDQDGVYYDVSNFSTETISEYSNVGAGLAGHYLELRSGQTLQEYGASQLFEPLGMENTGWTTESLTDGGIATAYLVDDAEITALPNYELATYPDGGLRSSAGDMTKFLALLMNDGRHDGSQLLQGDSIAEMIVPSALDDEYGFFIELENGIGHTGSDPGAVSYMFYRPEVKVGVVIIFNGEIDDVDEEELEGLIDLLFTSAQAI